MTVITKLQFSHFLQIFVAARENHSYVIFNDWLVGTVVQLNIDCAKMAGAGGGGGGIGGRWCLSSWLRFGYLAGGEWAVAALAVAREGRSPILAATVRCSREEDLAPELEDI